MKPRAMKGYEAQVSALQVSALERSKEGRTPKCPKADKAVAKSNVQKREGHRNVQRQIRLSLKATFKEGRTPKCPKADRAVTEGNFRKRGGHVNVQGG
jgi:hypothetical protein